MTIRHTLGAELNGIRLFIRKYTNSNIFVTATSDDDCWFSYRYEPNDNDTKISTSMTQVTTYDYNMDTFYIGLGVRLLQRCESISIFYEELVYTVL